MTTESDIVAVIESILGRPLFVSSGDLDLLAERDPEALAVWRTIVGMEGRVDAVPPASPGGADE